MRFSGKFTVPLFMVLCFFILSILDFSLARAEAPTPEEQLFIYELNRARNKPTRFQTENNLRVNLSSVDAQPPLAINEDLIGSSRFKAQEMADKNYFAHESPFTGWPNALARSFGYNLASFLTDNANNIESIAAGFNSVIDWTQPSAPLVTLIVDDGVPSLGHRIHLLAMDSFNQQFREIGVGFGSNIISKLKNYWAIHTGFDDNDQPFLTGVVYNDKNKNGRFDLNEGLGGVTVSLGSTSTTTSNSAGGWSIRAGSGPRTVQCSGGSFIGAGTANVTVDIDNIEVDFISGNSSGAVNFDNDGDGGGNGGSGLGCSSSLDIPQTKTMSKLMNKLKDKIESNWSVEHDYIELYNDNIMELTQIVNSHPALASRLRSERTRFMLSILLFIFDEPVVFSATDIERIEIILETINVYASPQLKDAIDQIRSDLHSEEIMSSFSISVESVE
ncbi:MAG: CAP domain-containing protein [Candidatus Anammoxibacter sp.]